MFLIGDAGGAQIKDALSKGAPRYVISSFQATYGLRSGPDAKVSIDRSIDRPRPRKSPKPSTLTPTFDSL